MKIVAIVSVDYPQYGISTTGWILDDGSAIPMGDNVRYQPEPITPPLDGYMSVPVDLVPKHAVDITQVMLQKYPELKELMATHTVH